MGTTAHFDSQSDNFGQSSLVAAIIGGAKLVPGFFVSLSNAYAASREFDRLCHLSDGQLAALGIEREEIGKHIATNFLAD